MKQEDKDLLFNDLCARLPYHVRVKVWLKDGTTEEGVLDLEHNYADVLRDAFYYNKIIDIKPYLRHLSSITQEEDNELNKMLTEAMLDAVDSGETGYTYKNIAHNLIAINFFNKKMLDYRELIPKGLAIEVTEENNPYK